MKEQDKKYRFIRQKKYKIQVNVLKIYKIQVMT